MWIVVAALAVAAAALALVEHRHGAAADAVAMPESTEAAGTWAAGEKRAPTFALRDEDGKRVSLAGLRGRPVLVTFIDPLCRDYCPTEAKELSDVARAVPRAAIVAVSVNVYGNAPHLLRQDRRKWSVTGQWRWAVGSAAELERVWKAYKILVIARTKTVVGVKVHQIGHTEASYLIDANGDQRALFLWPYSANAVAKALRALS